MKRRVFSLAMAAILAGCASVRTRYYRIAPVQGVALGGSGQRIGVRDAGVPAYLAQSGLAEPGGAYQLNLYPNDLWAAPLATMLQSAMVQNLAQRLPGDDVLAAGGAIGAVPDIYVEIQILRFEPDASGNVTLQAQLATRPAATAETGWSLRAFTATAPGGATPDGLAAAMSALWGQAADVLAGMLA